MKTFIRLCIFLSLLNIGTVQAVNEVHHLDDQFIVWPLDNEGGTFYLENKPINGKWKRKGYLRAYTPITVINNTEQWVDESRYQNSGEYLYVGFIAANGVFGMVRKNQVQPINKLRSWNKKKISIYSNSNIIQPINPFINGDVALFSITGEHATQIGSFSRSQLQFVVSQSKQKKLSSGNGSRDIYIDAKYFMKTSEGDYQLKQAWVKKNDLEHKYLLIPIMSQIKAFRAPSDLSNLEKIRLIWQYWTTPNSEMLAELAEIPRKPCNIELSINAGLKGEVKVPLKFVEFGAEVKGELTYKFPRGYRYSTALFQDQFSKNNISLLRKIKCKEHSNDDWYAESISYAFSGEGFSIYQDDVLRAVQEYFELPVAIGGNGKIEKMLRLKDLENKDLDYYSAYYLLSSFLYKNIYQELNLTSEEKIRLNAFLMEHITQLR